MNFLKNAGPVARNKPSSTAPHSSSPSWRKKFAPSKKNLLLNIGNQSTSTFVPKENRALTSATAVSRAPPSLPATWAEKSVSQTDSTDTQTTLLLKVVECLDCQQEELNFLREYPSLSRDWVRSRPPFQRNNMSPRHNQNPQTWNSGKPAGQQTNGGRSHLRGRQNLCVHQDQSQRRDQSRRPFQRRDKSRPPHDQY